MPFMAGEEQRSGGQADGIRWLRILGIGLLAELALSVVAVPFAFMPGGRDVMMYAVVPATLILFIPFGYWAARPLRSRFVLHGLLTGAVGVVLYIVLILGATSLPGAPPMDWATSFSPSYLLTHALKLVGGALGGALAARKSRGG
jgi:hypothetical protein